MARSSTGAFFVDNMLGDIGATLAVANSESSGEYPEQRPALHERRQTGAEPIMQPISNH